MKRLAAVSVLACVLSAGCAVKNTAFVLVPDRDAHVGTMTVSNAKGSSMAERANDAILVAGPNKAPAKPVPMDPALIRQKWGAALAAEPEPPLITRVYFATASSELDPATMATLQKVVSEIVRRQSQDISVNGHTDTTGEAETNMRISLERATAVRTFLVNAGVRAESITLSYHGKGNPLIPTGDNVDEPRNRRVEVIVR